MNSQPVLMLEPSSQSLCGENGLSKLLCGTALGWVFSRLAFEQVSPVLGRATAEGGSDLRLRPGSIGKLGNRAQLCESTGAADGTRI